MVDHTLGPPARPSVTWTQCRLAATIMCTMAEQAKTTDQGMEHEAKPLSDAQKWAARLVCLIAALAMRYAGLLALWPRDPGLPPSLLTCRSPGLATVEMMALGAVVSALVVAVIGRRLAGMGVMAVGAGLLAIGWSDADWRLTVAYVQQASDGWAATNIRLMGETLGWAAVVLAALAAEYVTREWLGLEVGPEDASRISVMYSRTSAFVRAIWQSHEQWLMLIAAGLAGLVLVEVLYTNPVGAKLGQGYFVVGVAMMAGVLLGHQVFTVRVVWPAALGWLVPALAGHAWAILGQDRATVWMVQGINPLADMLPIQYAAGGTMGGIVGLWLSGKVIRWRNGQGVTDNATK